MELGVKTREGKVWAADEQGLNRVWAIGDCNYGCVDAPGKPPDDWPIPPIPKISYPGEEEAIIACANLHWPWGAGMFATSLGPDDACFVAGANWVKNSGYVVTWASVAAVQKEIIEATITD